jgi:hypothetical protein
MLAIAAIFIAPDSVATFNSELLMCQSARNGIVHSCLYDETDRCIYCGAKYKKPITSIDVWQPPL